MKQATNPARRFAVVAALAMVLALVAVVAPASARSSSAELAVGRTGAPDLHRSAAAARVKKKSCVVPAKGFRPRQIAVLGKNRKVVKVKRTADGAVGTPPVTNKGKHMVGWDPQRKPGNGKGTVILVAHTWPDGSALGNAMLRKLKKGALLKLKGAKIKGAAERVSACYKITKRRSYKAAKVPRKKAFRPWGKEQAVIVVCSGKRLGPGNWSRRTVWYAKPLPKR